MLLTRMIGPFSGTGTIALAFTVLTTMHERWSPRLMMTAMSLAIVLPVVSDLIGILPPMYAFKDGMMCLVPGVADLPRAWTFFGLTLVALSSLILGYVGAVRLRRIDDTDASRLRMHAWYLKRLMPEEAHPQLP